MLLSIVMMVKNEERYLAKTLESLKPLMKEIDSELIILDTGSDDSTVEIAKKHTDKVFFANWSNDFGQMRNISISHASGEWILILDADEQLTNYDKLKEFFNSNLCKKYNSATITLKNIFSEDEDRYSIDPLLRLFKNYDGFRYEGAIHEQPIFKSPTYNDIARFNHYGYLFEDEEVRQLKESRNKAILLKEIEKNPNNPYINYQLGKQYIISKNYEDALFYIEKGYEIYEKNKYIPLFVTLDLANLYVDLSEFDKCENLCIKYIKKDDRNIDIYYYLGTSQKQLNKNKKSIESYKRYLYLTENFDITTQANNTECNYDTLLNKEKAIINIIDNYYKLEMYEDVIKDIDEISISVLEEAYLVIFMSLYKLNKEDKIIELFNKISGSKSQENKFKVAIESILNRVKENDKPKFYKILSTIDDNYGILNKIRLGLNLNEETYNEILIKEKEVYFSEILYYAIENNFNIENVLNNVSYIKMQNFTDYLVKTKRECIIKLYNYLENVSNTMDYKKIQTYACLSKSLLMYGNLVGDKYKKIFYMYISYNYECLKIAYNINLKNEESINLLRNEEDEFIVKLKRIEKYKSNDELTYIRKLKDLLIDNPYYKKCIKLLISDFEKELNENTELKELKTKYKLLIESSINGGDLDESIKMINEYESMFSEEFEILNMKAIIALMRGELDNAEKLLKNSWIYSSEDFNVIFNIAYLKELIGDKQEAKQFYENIINNCNEDDIVREASENIKKL
ncbi:glycosyltransferase [Paraclostridium sordellii]|uniref:glycosyltransferase n=1 Tax=Paraclostridium sordellii TaxID=1505 RepID=UPI0005EA368C|nr:glycosyltransferase [Paeniclostridium sordellii]MCQ4698269.1 glycosyltransferase [Paeniclostridium sordellii]MDU4414112.1 glycosyltransferase [Paeniclostridium sordellii]MDU6481889.1 glycosyltransferase [Paeniclostridium sordellii]CEN23547.1 glycosyltransferase [[Clostridium] sordellii] [Paeniclostridium sordellii]CEN24470.1 glycosyltransferase [[Clostridium] sordellii] [Paeniclostridium sordellii]